jgi:hypothetical protein
VKSGKARQGPEARRAEAEDGWKMEKGKWKMEKAEEWKNRAEGPRPEGPRMWTANRPAEGVDWDVIWSESERERNMKPLGYIKLRVIL